MKGVSRIYQQTFVDTYSKVTFAKLYDRKTPITAADLLNDRVVPFFDEKEVKLSRVLTDRGTEYCGNPEHHEYELYLAWRISIIPGPRRRAHRRTESVNAFTRRCWTSSIVLRSARNSMLPSRTCRTISIYGIKTYNEDRPHQGRWCSGKMPLQTFLDTIPIAKETMIAA